MTKLENVLKNHNGLVCIKFPNGEIDRIKLLKANRLVENGEAFYCSKSQYKTFLHGNPQAKKAVEVKIESTEPKKKMKRKEIRKSDKHQK